MRIAEAGLRQTPRDRFVADSTLEQAGFEPSVPLATELLLRGGEGAAIRVVSKCQALLTIVRHSHRMPVNARAIIADDDPGDQQLPERHGFNPHPHAIAANARLAPKSGVTGK
jgi:hypothetical protein